MAEPQQKPPTSAPSVGPQRIKVGVMPLFSTWIYQCEDGPRHLNQRLERLAHKLMQDDRNATRRTNYGGWHYAVDLFDLPGGGSGLGISFSPATGRLLLFPGWLEHRVEPFEGSVERLSIAFNASNPRSSGTWD